MSTNVGNIHYNLDLKTQKFDAAVNNVDKQTATLGNGLKNIGSRMTNLGAKLSVFSAGVLAVAKNYVDLASDLQTTQKRMESLSGSVKEGRKVFGELYQYTIGKPIEFPTAAKAAQTLMGYGVESKKVVEAMKTLSAFTVVNGADMGQLALAYGQVNAKGKLMGQEVLQLTNNFVPVTDVIAKHFNVSIAEAQELLEDGKVSAEDFNAAMAGFIPQSKIDEQANTFKNRMITLQGTLRNFALELLGIRIDPELGLVIDEGGLFDRFTDILQTLVDKLKAVKEWYDNLSPAQKRFIEILALVLVSIGPILLVLGLLTSLVGTIIALFGNPIFWAVVGVLALIAAVAKLVWENWDKIYAAVKPVYDIFMESVWPVLKDMGVFIKDTLVAALNDCKDAWNANYEAIKPLLPVLKLLAIILGSALIGAVVVVVFAILGVILIFTKFISIVARTSSAVVSFVSRVVGYIATFATAVIRGFVVVVQFIASVPGRIRGALGGLGGLLGGAGRALMRGFLDGIVSGWNTIKEKVGGMSQWIKDHKGPIDKDKVLLVKEGAAIMGGLNKGISIGYKGVQETIGDITKSLAATTVPVQSVNQAGTLNSDTKIYGNINIGDKQDADYFFNRMNRNQDLLGLGLAPIGGM